MRSMALPNLPIPVPSDRQQEDGGDFSSKSQTHRGAEPRDNSNLPHGHMIKVDVEDQQ